MSFDESIVNRDHWWTANYQHTCKESRTIVIWCTYDDLIPIYAIAVIVSKFDLKVRAGNSFSDIPPTQPPTHPHRQLASNDFSSTGRSPQ